MGSWVVYGLGSENQNLPAYVVLDDPLGLPINGPRIGRPGFLPPVYPGHAHSFHRIADSESRPEEPNGPEVVTVRARTAVPPGYGFTSRPIPVSCSSMPASPAMNWRPACR